jgi:hypothetical protein
MRRALLVLLVLLAPPLALVAAVVLALEDRPLVARPAALGAPDLERVKRLLEHNDPRRPKSGAPRTVSLSQQDVQLLADHFAGRFTDGGARIGLERGRATVAASVELPRSPAGRFVNVRAALRDTGDTILVEQLRVGRVSVPDWLANALVEQGLGRLRENADFRAATSAVAGIRLREGRVDATFEWQSDLPARLTRALLPREEQARLRPYQERLAQVTREASGGAALPLVTVLGSLFDLAGDRGSGGDAAAENRAALLVLGVYSSGRGLGAIVPDATGWPRAAARKVTLNGRADLAQHFAVSAALAATAGSAVADAIGLQKELDDSRGGSGFSFGDLAADRAGTRFGAAATASGASARALQARMRAGVRDPEIMVDTAGLPDFMPEAEFKRRFGGVDAPAYRRMAADIERRIDALPVHR